MPSTVQWDAGTLIPDAKGPLNGSWKSVVIAVLTFRLLLPSNNPSRGVPCQPRGDDVRRESAPPRRPCAGHQCRIKRLRHTASAQKEAISKLQPLRLHLPDRWQRSSTAPGNLVTCSQVLIRVDALRRPMQPPHGGTLEFWSEVSTHPSRFGQ